MLGRPAGRLGYSGFHLASQALRVESSEPGRKGTRAKPLAPSAVCLAAAMKFWSTMVTPTKNGWLSPSSLAWRMAMAASAGLRSEEHTSELQSQSNLVCRLLLEKKKKET